MDQGGHSVLSTWASIPRAWPTWREARGSFGHLGFAQACPKAWPLLPTKVSGTSWPRAGK